MKTDTKLVSVRLPLSDYERLQELSDFFGESISSIIKTAIHCGLIIGESAADGVLEGIKKGINQDGEGK